MQSPEGECKIQNEYINLPILESFKSQRDWQNWLINSQELNLFKKRDIIVKILAFLLHEYYNLNKISYKLPEIRIRDIIKTDNFEVSKSNRFATQIYNSIHTIKKSKYNRSEGSNKIENIFLEYKINYLNLADTQIRLLPEALFIFFKMGSIKTMFL